MLYKNRNYRKTKNSHRILILCSHCKEKLLEYDKLGRGGLLRLYPWRILSSSMDLGQEAKAIKCSNCKEIIAVRLKSQKNQGQTYSMLRGSFNIKRL